VRVVVVDPSINVRELRSFDGLKRSGERTMEGKTVESLTRDGFPGGQSREQAHQNNISMENVMKHTISARKSRASKPGGRELEDIIETSPLLVT
jgi:hypothetical protein